VPQGNRNKKEKKEGKKKQKRKRQKWIHMTILRQQRFLLYTYEGDGEDTFSAAASPDPTTEGAIKCQLNMDHWTLLSFPSGAHKFKKETFIRGTQRSLPSFPRPIIPCYIYVCLIE
jgi:hypothetical protein